MNQSKATFKPRFGREKTICHSNTMRNFVHHTTITVGPVSANLRRWSHFQTFTTHSRGGCSLPPSLSLCVCLFELNHSLRAHSQCVHRHRSLQITNVHTLPSLLCESAAHWHNINVMFAFHKMNNNNIVVKLVDSSLVHPLPPIWTFAQLFAMLCGKYCSLYHGAICCVKSATKRIQNYSNAIYHCQLIEV